LKKRLCSDYKSTDSFAGEIFVAKRCIIVWEFSVRALHATLVFMTAAAFEARLRPGWLKRN